MKKNLLFLAFALIPSMASIAMIAETQHSDGDYAAGMIFITTLFSIVTLPLVCLSL